MLRMQLPERPSFRFGRKSYVEAREKAHALEETNIETLRIQPHTPLPLVHHTSTDSLLGLFQSQNDSEFANRTLENGERTILSPVSPFDALGSHGDPNSMYSIPVVAFENEHSAASTPSSGYREDDDTSRCSRKSSTSSVGTPLAGHKAYFDAMAALNKEVQVVEIPSLDAQPIKSPQELEISPTRSMPQYDKPLPPPPSTERPFSVSSVLSIIRAESRSKTGQRPCMQMVADAPVIFRRQTQVRPRAHGRSASDSALRSKTSATFKAKSPIISPRSKRGARLGNAMKEGRLHSRAQTLSSITFLVAGSARPERPRPLSMASNNRSTPIQSKVGPNYGRQPREQPPVSIEPSSAEKVVLEIMKRLDEPADLLATAAVSRGFREAFKRAEPRLVHELLLRHCPAAWEFQKNSARASGTTLSLRAYTKDEAALKFVKTALLASYSSSLDLEIIAGLTGVDVTRESRINAALWRIWTFCKGFGHRSLSEDDIPIQVDWLNGGRIARKRQIKTAVGRGNRNVSLVDLEDLLEMWDHLGMLLSRFNDDVTGARTAGIFEGCTIDEKHTQEWFLEEWTYYIRSLGLPAVLSVTSATTFEQLKASGFTDWTPPLHGQTRAGFFRAAMSTVYQERILAEAAAKATQFALPPRSRHRPNASDASINSLEQLTRALEKRAGQQQSLKIITTPGPVRRKPILKSSTPKTAWQPETPDTPYPVQRHDSKQEYSQHDQPESEPEVQRESLRDGLTSPIRNSVVLQSLGMTPTASTRLGATLFPMEYPVTSPRDSVLSTVSPVEASRLPSSRSEPDDMPPVIDPVDKAMKLLTEDMGFSVKEASRALAKCDTGFGIDVQKAIEMLASESGRTLSSFPGPQPKTPTSPESVLAPTSPEKACSPKDTCTGHQERNTSNGSEPSIEINKPFEPLCDTHPVRQPSLLGNLNRNSLRGLTRMGSKAKAFTLGIEKLDKSASQALGVEETRPPRIASLKASHGSIEQPWQPLPAAQRPKSKMPPRKAKSAHKSKLMGIDEEPCSKAMQILGVDEVEIVDGRISAATGATKSKSKPAKRFYEGRFGSLGWSDAGSVK